MLLITRAASVALAVWVTGVAASAQSPLTELLQRHGVQVRNGSFEAAFDSYAAPTVPVTPGSLATPLALLTSAGGNEQIAAAYAFGILGGRSGRAASDPELAAAGQALVAMIGSVDRKSRIAGARVAGRLFAAPFDRSPRPAVPPGMIDGLFALLNHDDQTEQLAAMDGLGLLREVSAVASITERYHYYRDGRMRALAGGALEALARIGDPSTIALVKQLVGDPWAGGKDATALVVVYARERMLTDGSIALIRVALDDKSRRDQARGYLIELGASVP
jgi:HEAT repeat protein